jgi:hypothetical protein
MARSEARLAVEIWNDEDFLALTSEAQRMFMFLISQSDLAHDGVIALRVRRWCNSARGLSAFTVASALEELSAARFIVVDEAAEELLIRSFIRRDKVFKQPNVLRAAADHLPLVTGSAIRMALAVELARISQTPMPEASAGIIAEMRQALPDPTHNPPPNPSPDPSGKASGNHAPGTPGERGMVTAVQSALPVPLSPNPRSPDPVALATLALVQQDHKIDPFDRFWAAYPRREAKDAAKRAWAKAIKRTDPTLIIAGAERYRDDPNRDPTFTAHAATWLNAGRWADDALPARASPNGIRDHNGLRLSDRTIENLEREKRLTAIDEQRAIGGMP